MARWRRILLLIVCLLTGGLVAVVGHGLSGHGAWALAVPAALAIGGWAAADPTTCLPSNDTRESERR